jgi:DNA-binding Xre family transcriptional regulator
MINPAFDSGRELEKHFKWEIWRMAEELKKIMRDRNFDPNELVRKRIVSASSLSAFLDKHQPIDIATLTMIAQYLNFDFCLDFRDPSNKASRIIVLLPSAKNEDIVRAVNSGFRLLFKGRQIRTVAYIAGLSISTVYNFTRVIPQHSLVPVAVTVPDLFTVFKCARGCGYETYLWISNPLITRRFAS